MSRSLSIAAAAVVVALASCARDAAPAPAPPTPPAPTPAATTLAYIEDDWDEALRRAKAGGKILFVDAWAPWCHTCWGMKRDVLHDASLNAFVDRVVFAEVDTDRPMNAAFVAKFPVRGWPTFFAIDGATERILAVQGGSMSVPEMRAFLDRALAARAGAGPEDAALAAAYGALQSGDPRGAAERFEEAAKLAGPRSTEALTAAVRAWREAKEHVRCLETGTRALELVQGSAAAGDTASLVLLCADAIPDGDATQVAARTAGKAAAQKKLEALVASPAAGASVDDRADIMINLAEVYDGLGKKDEARALHEKRLALLEADAQHADPEHARVHDYARMNSYLALGRGDDAVALFRARIAQLPKDYESYARLASTLHKLGRDAEARPVAETAVSLSYGPRRLRYLALLAEIAGKQGDAAGELGAHTQLVTENAALPEKLRLAELAAKSEVRLKALR